MSFAQNIKQEIANRRIVRPCCAKAAAYAAACFGRYFDARGVVVQTDLAETARCIQVAYRMAGLEGDIIEKERANGRIYEFAVKEPGEVERMLACFGHTGREANLRINPGNLACGQCAGWFAAAAFLCSGTATDPQKGYNLEFSTPRRNLARDFEALLAEHEFLPHRTLRKGSSVVYVKASEKIEELLTFMGATNAALEVMNSKIYKDIRNKTNRLTNCETANMDKTATANAQTARAIRYLQQKNALDALPEPLRQAAALRLEYPEYSLAQLAAVFVPPVSKSGLSHRLKKLEEIAQQMQEREQHG